MPTAEAMITEDTKDSLKALRLNEDSKIKDIREICDRIIKETKAACLSDENKIAAAEEKKRAAERKACDARKKVGQAKMKKENNPPKERETKNAVIELKLAEKEIGDIETSVEEYKKSISASKDRRIRAEETLKNFNEKIDEIDKRRTEYHSGLKLRLNDRVHADRLEKLKDHLSPDGQARVENKNFLQLWQLMENEDKIARGRYDSLKDFFNMINAADCVKIIKEFEEEFKRTFDKGLLDQALKDSEDMTTRKPQECDGENNHEGLQRKVKSAGNDNSPPETCLSETDQGKKITDIWGGPFWNGLTKELWKFQKNIDETRSEREQKVMDSKKKIAALRGNFDKTKVNDGLSGNEFEEKLSKLEKKVAEDAKKNEEQLQALKEKLSALDTTFQKANREDQHLRWEKEGQVSELRKDFEAIIKNDDNEWKKTEDEILKLQYTLRGLKGAENS